MTPEQLAKFNEMFQWFQDMQASSSIPLSTDQAIRARFLGDIGTTVATSSKGATTENHAVNESGAASYSVLGIPDGFLQTVISGATYYIPFYS